MKWWEDLCTHCGLCCHEKIRLEKDLFLIYPERPCQFLDRENSRCKVYERRFSLCPSCRKMNLFRAMFAPWLPPGCAYVQWAARHHLRFARKCEWVFALDENDSQ